MTYEGAEEEILHSGTQSCQSDLSGHFPSASKGDGAPRSSNRHQSHIADKAIPSSCRGPVASTAFANAISLFWHFGIALR